MSDITTAAPRTPWSRLTAAARSLDPVWLAVPLLFLGLALFVPGQVVPSAEFTLDAFLWILPFLLLSVLLAAWLKAAGADVLIGRAVRGSPVAAIGVAALIGALSPFCSCGVVPLVAALMAAGMPLPAVMAFWISSPLMDPESFVLMAATLGIGFTLAKTLAAIAMGLLGGFGTLVLDRAGFLPSPLKAAGCGSCGGGLDEGPVVWAFWREPPRRQAFGAESLRVGLFLGKWLLLAFAIESLMVAWLPPETIGGLVGGQQAFAIPLAVVVGVPAYLNGFAAIPLIGQLVEMGMAPGAALAFLTAGAVTSIPAAMAVFALVRWRVFLLYLVLALTGSLLTGYGYQAVLAL